MAFKPSLYPQNWQELRTQTLTRAENLCECRGECGSEHEGERCSAPNGLWIVRYRKHPAFWRTPGLLRRTELLSYEAPIKVILTCAHLCHQKSCADLSHLRALCQRCHLLLDRCERAIARQRAAEAHRQGRLL